MFQDSFTIRRMSYLAILVAMSYVLKSVFTLELLTVRFSFYEIPLFLTGVLFGPYYGLLIGFINDTLHIMTPNNFAVGYNLMTVAGMLWGLAGGLFFYRRRTLQPVKLAVVIAVTYLLYFAIISLQLYGPARYTFFNLSPFPDIFLRIVGIMIRIPLHILFVKVLFTRVIAESAVHQYVLDPSEHHG
ncbi:MAG: folate family ECF transporter S component [Acholeplasmatales bacterium]|nr:MAG: folate family ECF transporter S component [Acholeplasmatales bacterium]